MKLTYLFLLSNIVIADFGNTQDLKNYFSNDATSAEPKTATISSVQSDLKKMFPLETDLTLSNRKYYQELDQKYHSLNMALIGVDSISLEFLKTNFQTFKKNNTVIAVISVEKYNDYMKLKNVCDQFGLHLSLLNSDFLKDDIKQYPILISGGFAKND